MAENQAPHYYELVYDIVRLIPRGRVSTYGAISDFLALGSARMVGWALFRGVLGDDVPAHRVVNSKGELSGRNHFLTPTTMAERLQEEGVSVSGDKVQGFETFFWHPKEL